jgi:hypothetical protein
MSLSDYCSVPGPLLGGGDRRYVCSRPRGHDGKHCSGTFVWEGDLGLGDPASRQDILSLEKALTKAIQDAVASIQDTDQDLDVVPPPRRPHVLADVWAVITPGGTLLTNTLSRCAEDAASRYLAARGLPYHTPLPEGYTIQEVSLIFKQY